MLTCLTSARRAAALLTCAAIFGSTPALSASLVEISGFGQNPSNLRMHVYAPDRLASPPPILVAIHFCTGSGPTFFNGTEFRTLADQNGFIVIYPSATRSGQCFDVSSPQALRRGGGSDPVSIMSMVTYVIQSYNADANRVYVTGASSGAMMTNVLLGNYPDVFKAGAAFMGVPHSCFATTDGSMWNSTCANGQLIRTAQEWGNLARAAFPGYTGARPRMQLWHGTTDTTPRFPNFNEEIKQWTNVLGVSQTPSFTDSPQANWTRTRYGGTGVGAPVEAISLSGVGHSLPQAGQAALAIQFFGLNSSTTPPNPGGGSKTIVVRARGTAGGESISLRVNNTNVQTWTLTTTMQNYTATTTLSGGITVAFTNDGTNRDVQVDNIQVNGQTRQSEAQSVNTGLYANGRCGGGSNSEWMHCNGEIGYGNTP